MSNENETSSPVNKQDKIMYVCGPCTDVAPESCGYFDRNELRVMPDGTWLCEGCFENGDLEDYGVKTEDPFWSDFKAPPEYTPARSNPSKE